MIGKKKRSGTALSIPAGLGVGLLISLTVTIAGAALTAWLIANEKIGEGSAGYAAMVILAIATGLGVLTSVYLIKKQRLQVSMLSGICYYLTLLAMTALFFGGQYQGMGVSAIIVLGVSAIIAFLPTKNSPARGKRKRVYR